MKWAKNKTSPSSSSSSSHSSVITRVFPFSWFSKFKQRGSESIESNSWQRSELDFQTHNPSYSMDDNDDDDAYSRNFFREERIEGRRSVGAVNPVCYDSYDEFQVPVMGFKSLDLGEMEVTRRAKCQSFDNMVLDVKKTKEKQHKKKNDLEKGDFRIKKPNVEANRYLNLEHLKLKEIKVKNESVCTSRESNDRKIKQKNRVKRAYSPRTECRIRVLEDMKKARMKLKKKKKETEDQPVQGRAVFDSFAVVKSSFNPQQDFKDSMLEMISEKGIYRAEDLEELLACYLTLNRDEYHDLIIKIFKQVWIELNRGLY